MICAVDHRPPSSSLHNGRMLIAHPRGTIHFLAYNGSASLGHLHLAGQFDRWGDSSGRVSRSHQAWFGKPRAGTILDGSRTYVLEQSILA
jgi:hypothetical protein